MYSSSAIAKGHYIADFPQITIPIDDIARQKSSEADPNIKKFETADRDWVVSYCDAYKNSEDIENNKILETSISLEVKKEKDQPIIHFPPVHFREWRRGHFVSLRKWEGIVESLSKEGFIAKLKDVDREVPDERVEIDFDELTNVDERPLVKTGAIFSWTMGYSVTPSGTRKRQAILIFRRMPVWTEDDIEQGYKEADIMYAALHE